MSETNEHALALRSETALAPAGPAEIVEQATAEANVLARVINAQKLFSTISGRRYVRIEGWTTLSAMRGCLPREVEVMEAGDGRYIAVVELVRVTDGVILTRASAECGGPEEATWQGRPPYARRSMAITRATAKACRVAFSWVMALSGFETTPAEEMEGLPSSSGPRPVTTVTQPRRASEPRPAPEPPAADSSHADPFWGRMVKHTTKSGTKKNGQPWTLYLFTGDDGNDYGTFSESVSEFLLAHDGKNVEVAWELSEKGGRNIIEARPATVDM